MSYPRDCNGCAVGAHHRHDPKEGTRPGLIGGSYCGCTGDCAERFIAATERTRRLFGPVGGTATPADQMSERAANAIADLMLNDAASRPAPADQGERE